jgi:hypothetical protein
VPFDTPRHAVIIPVKSVRSVAGTVRSSADGAESTDRKWRATQKE